MRALNNIFIFSILFALLARPSVALENGKAEVFQFRTEIEGKPVTTFIELFPESPLENPKLIEQIKSAGLDHVLFYSETDDLGERSPSQIDSLDELESEIQNKTELPVIRVKQKKSFFTALKQAWKFSFLSKSKAPKVSDKRYGLISTIGESATYAALLITSGDTALMNGAALMAAQTQLSYYNNVYNNRISTFLNANWHDPKKEAKLSSIYFRSYLYDWLSSQIFKLIQSPGALLSAQTQSLIAMNSLMAGSGEMLTSSALYKAYGANSAKLAKMNFYVHFVGTALSSLDLMRHNLMPVLIPMGAYELTVSGAILMGYYLAAYAAVKLIPNKFYALVNRIDSGLKGLANLFGIKSKSCDKLMSGKSEILASERSISETF